MQNKHLLIVALIVGLGMTTVLLTVTRAETTDPADAVVASASSTGFPIAAISGDHQNPAAAYDEGRNRFLVVYESPSGGQNAACVNPDGTIVNTYVVGSGHNPDVVYSPDHDQYFIVYESAGNVEGQFVSGSCCFQVGCGGEPFTISGERPGLEVGPAVAYNTHGNHQDYLVVWGDNDGATYSIYGRQVLSLTQTPNPSFPIAYTSAAWNYEPDVAYNLNRNEYLVVYTHDASKGGDPSGLDIYGTLVKNAGGVAPLAENPIDSSGNNQHNASVAAYRLNYETPYLVAFTDYWNDPAGDVRAYLVYTTGVSSSLVNIATVSARAELLPALASSESLGAYTAVWMENNGGDMDVYWRRISPTGLLSPIAPIAAVNGKDERYPAVAGGSPAALGVWQELNADWDIYARVLGFDVYLPLVLRDR